jgi:hypothetical protein
VPGISYYRREAPGLLVFPFHYCCLGILAQVLTGVDDTSRIGKDALFDAMAGLIGRDSLDIDYGPISGQEQRWESVPGEEVRAWLITYLPSSG